MTTPAAAGFTWDDFVALDDEDRRELIDGELVEVEVPTWKHEDVVAMLCYFLTAWSMAGHGGRALASGYKVRISERRGVMPDVQFYRRGNDAPRGQEHGLVEGRPDLVVEVVSPTGRRYDRVKKLAWCAQKGSRSTGWSIPRRARSSSYASRARATPSWRPSQRLRSSVPPASRVSSSRSRSCGRDPSDPRLVPPARSTSRRS
jgi:Uma2 family endonuclease